MEQEFSASRGWKIFTYIFSITFIGLLLYAFIDSLLSGKDVLFWASFFFVLTAIFVYFIVATYRAKIIITDDEIILYGSFRKKQLLFRDIKGLRIRNNNITIVSNDPNRPNIGIGGYSYLKNNGELLSILQHRFADLDEIDYNNELTEILHDPIIGTGIEDRSQKLGGAKKIARLLNILGVGIMLWLWIYPYPYKIAVCSGLIYPIIVLVYFFKEQEIFTLLDTGKRSAYPLLSSAIVLPAIGLCVRMLVDLRLLDLKDCIVPVATTFVILGLVCAYFILTRESKNKMNNFYIAMFFCLVYSIGGTLETNCVFEIHPHSV